MNKILAIAALVLINLSAVYAQDKAVVAESSSKSQLEKIEEFNRRSNVSIKMFPNAATDVLYIEPELNADHSLIKILDITGRVMTELHTECGCNQLAVNLENYMDGLYVLTMYDESGRLVHIKRFYKE
ncbi:MAG: T9SS type A sorting domain-containing protein [Chitinophagales bacterium]